ncbi:aminopeptidase P family protein [Saccharopolyspora phatthalungensis]|uniref:Xaa-Pro aminopeptidase n=1 Tax=Saccharopolyspora phatthalungensis TaxID=664693 RepID=A0A840QI94_9PSEU|nr:aminopeptidase P family protein [Saccharopolyspora phatthalungensis]MBB5159810.1 Xaa-Pro aminopeptidase [Saccharopolyspora phatthalungensis]
MTDNLQVNQGSGGFQDVASAQRAHPRSTPALADFMAQGWADRSAALIGDGAAAILARGRRERLAAAFPGDRLIVPAGSLKVRSNDVTYLFRPHSAFAHLTGLGCKADPDSVLIIDVDEFGVHTAVVYILPSTGPGTEAFYMDGVRGEYTIGRRPTLEELADFLGVEVRPFDQYHEHVAKPVQGCVRLIRGASDSVDKFLDSQGLLATDEIHVEFENATDELRLVKDPWEIDQLGRAVDITITGFADVVEALPFAAQKQRGERVIESVFFGRARCDANDIGYGSTAAAGNNATNLHWDVCDGPVRPGDLLLLDAGVELDSLYTADITRTIPVSGRFTAVQRMIYDAVLEAADAAFAAAEVGRPFQDTHDAAVTVLARHLRAWGLLPVSVEESLSDTGQHHRRWMPHATSHHLGLDVHDCAKARREFYRGAVIRPGMVFTIEPGLYFKRDDLTVPPEFRGIGVRIEDDIVATDDGPINLSSGLPRTADDIESWMAPLLESGHQALALRDKA